MSNGFSTLIFPTFIAVAWSILSSSRRSPSCFRTLTINGLSITLISIRLFQEQAQRREQGSGIDVTDWEYRGHCTIQCQSRDFFWTVRNTLYEWQIDIASPRYNDALLNDLKVQYACQLIGQYWNGIVLTHPELCSSSLPFYICAESLMGKRQTRRSPTTLNCKSGWILTR